MFWPARSWCIQAVGSEKWEVGRRAKGKSSPPLALLPFSLLLTLPFFHPSQFILHPFLWRKAPIQVRDLGEELPDRANKHFSFYSPPILTLATGHSHLALPLGESLYGGDSQAQMFVGSGYSSLPSSSRANWYFLMEQLGDIPGSIPGGMTEWVE